MMSDVAIPKLPYMHTHTYITACRIDLEQEMDIKNARVVSYSNGVVNGSRAIIMCKEGYASLFETQTMTLQCFSDSQGPGNWVSVATSRDGREVLRSKANIVCFLQETCKC